MNCPYCGRPAEDGYIYCGHKSGSILWYPECGLRRYLHEKEHRPPRRSGAGQKLVHVRRSRHNERLPVPRLRQGLLRPEVGNRAKRIMREGADEKFAPLIISHQFGLVFCVWVVYNGIRGRICLAIMEKRRCDKWNCKTSIRSWSAFPKCPGPCASSLPVLTARICSRASSPRRRRALSSPSW